MPLPAPIVVRPARQEDADTIVAFSTAMALETEGRTLDESRLRKGTLSLLASPEHGFFMVAELPQADQPQIIGQLMITYEWSDWRNGLFWWVQSVYVHPEWRRQGVYRRMHSETVELAQTRGNVCGVRLYVERTNELAKLVYGRVGLTSSGYEVFESDFSPLNKRNHDRS
jgi:ribosomal protein S18 acetylase RimI-like enzyme